MKWLEKIFDPMKKVREENQAKKEEILNKRIIIARYNATLAWNAKEGVDKENDKRHTK